MRDRMSIVTDLTRMWLTRSTKPFTFYNEYDQNLDYADCENLGLYVHIPFCKNICNFCPYCKEVYSKEKCDRYIDYLLDEIHMVGSQFLRQNKRKTNEECANEIKIRKEVTSLYFGGGTPALAVDRIGEIIDAINQHFILTEGIGLDYTFIILQSYSVFYD